MGTHKKGNECQDSGSQDASGVENEPVACVIGYIDTPELNRLWAERYARSGHDLSGGESVVAEREMNATTWELSVVNLGYPKLEFETGGRKLKLCKNLLTDLRLELSKPNGMPARQAIRIEQSGASGKVLEVTLDSSDLHAQYHKQQGSEVRLHWSNPATYEIEGDRVSADRFKQHYEPLKRIKLATLTKPVSAALADAWVYFEHDNEQTRSYVFSQPRQTAAGSGQLQASEGEDAAVAFHVLTFPVTLTQLPPADKNWVIGLFAPSGSLTWGLGGYIPPMEYYLGAYKALGAAQAQAIPANTAQGLQLSPLVTFCDRGGRPEEVELMPAGAQATWKLEEPERGKLLLQEGKHYYEPPKSINPEVRFNQSGDTFIPAAYRASIDTPTATDIIKVTSGGETTYSTFVIRWVHPTHFIRVAKQTSGLKLSLFFLNRSQQEQAVPDSQVSWQVVAGNGSVVSGIFKPAAQNPSPYSVVRGVDETRQDEWRWGLTIIALPILDIDTLVDFYSR
ncbi:hypothetical protein ACIPZG_23815 [Pseudomonas sp. NPDC089395]|uniref:hypothetical protein n=1 Tax=Pseudomonas sp. NPDC089395 TaxID=3364460 RepID=UPI0037FBDDFB